MSKAKAETVKAQCDAEETDGWIYTIKEINAERNYYKIVITEPDGYLVGELN